MDSPPIPTAEVPPGVLAKWQRLADLLCRLAKVPVALVTRVDDPSLEVMVASRNDSNPFAAGDRFSLADPGLYCGRVVRTAERLLVPDARAEDDRLPPDGLVSYLGYPIRRLDGTVFGTLCIRGREPNPYDGDVADLMLEFTEVMESHLELLARNRELAQAFENISELNNELEISATTDSLTGLLNRRAFAILIGHVQARQRRKRERTCLLLADIDRFKRLNDTLGHVAGDRALRLLADVVRDRIRQQDMAFRWGGEEFLIALPDCDRAGGVRLAEDLRAALAGRPLEDGNGRRHLTVSIGVSELAPDENPEDCVARCDALMYEAKRAGRDRVCAGSDAG